MDTLPSDGPSGNPNPLVSVFPDKYQRGADNLGDERPPATIMPLDKALCTQYQTDAHFSSYFIPGVDAWPRLKKTVLPILRAEGLNVFSGALVFDFDTPGHRPWGSEMELDAFLLRLNDAGEKCVALKYSIFYQTRAGARTIHRLIPPLHVDEAECWSDWMIEMFRKYGIGEIDAGCADWTRLFRLPYVTRDGVATWEGVNHVG